MIQRSSRIPGQALKDGVVLAVHGEQHAARLPGAAHHEFPGQHQGLLVGHGHLFARIDGGVRGPQTHRAHHTRTHLLHPRIAGGLQQPLHAGQDGRGAAAGIFGAQPFGDDHNFFEEFVRILCLDRRSDGAGSENNAQRFCNKSYYF